MAVGELRQHVMLKSAQATNEVDAARLGAMQCDEQELRSGVGVGGCAVSPGDRDVQTVQPVVERMYLDRCCRIRCECGQKESNVEPVEWQAYVERFTRGARKDCCVEEGVIAH